MSGVLRMVTKDLEKRLEEFKIRGRIEFIQNRKLQIRIFWPEKLKKLAVSHNTVKNLLFNFDYTNKWYFHKSESEAYWILQGFKIQTLHLISTRSAILELNNKKEIMFSRITDENKKVKSLTNTWTFSENEEEHERDANSRYSWCTRDCPLKSRKKREVLEISNNQDRQTVTALLIAATILRRALET